MNFKSTCIYIYKFKNKAKRMKIILKSCTEAAVT